MKKFLFFFLILGMSLNISAQQVEVMGIAMQGEVTGSIPVIDGPNLVDVTLYSIYLNSNDVAPTGDVNYWDNTPENVDIPFTPVGINLGGVPSGGLGYYTTVFDDDVDGAGENIIVDAANTENTYSFYAFVKRDDPFANYYSVADYTHVHCWANGESNKHTYPLALVDNGLNRSITITMPFSGLENNEDNLNRVAVVEIAAAGMTTIVYEFTGNNVGDFFHLFTSPSFDVPASTDMIYVSVYSPDTPWGGGDPRPTGDSFMCGGVVADVVDDNDDPGCTLTQGYWKTHGFDAKPKKFDETWNNLKDVPFFSSGLDYYGAINEKAKGNAYYILAHQYVAAKLNFLAGADPAEALDAFNDATALFTGTDPEDIKKLKGDDPLRQQFITAAGILDDYNNGIIGPGHCDDKSTYAEIDTSSDTELNIYPNPMSTSGTIDFTVANEDQTTVEMYNLMGQKVATLFDQPTQVDQKYQIRIDANRYQKGLYVIYLKNGSSTVTKKVNIN